MKKITLLIILMISSLGFAQPTTSAPLPTKLPADVVSIYSGAYTTNIATNYNPFWGQSGSVNVANDPGDGNLCMAYTNFNYQGTDLTTTNASTMEYLHIDIWTSNATVVKVSPINNGTGAGEFLLPVTLTNGGWSSVDLPKSAFTGMTWDSVFQLKFDGQAGTSPSTIYLDNIYFWKAPVTTGSDATLSDLKIDGTTISGFSSGVTSYTISLPNGTTVIPQITATTTTDALASKTITQASVLPGAATVNVTSQNTLVTKTYTVNFVVTGPGAAAPTPPSRASGDVISLFSDAYSNIGVTEWSTSWDAANIADISVVGNATKKITYGDFLGVQLSSYTNATAMTHFHMDYYIDAGTDLTGKVLNPKLSNHAAQGGETGALLLTNLPTVTGSWVQLDVPLSTFTAQGAGVAFAREAVYQFLISSNIGTVYVDNIYLHKNTVLGTTKFEASSVKMYPNPATTSLTIQANSAIDKVSVYNILGQEVITKNPKSNDTTLDISSLQKGTYIVKTTSDGKTDTAKVLKK